MKKNQYCLLSYDMLADSRLQVIDAVVYGILWDYCTDGTNCCRIKIDTLVHISGISRCTFLRSLKMLEATGYISMKRTRTASIYTLLADILPPKTRKKGKKNEKPKQIASALDPDDDPLEGQLDFLSDAKQIKTHHGKYSHVELTEAEHQELVHEFGEDKVKEYIQKVDNYCEQHGKKYANYAVTICNWISEDKEKTGTITYLDLFTQLPSEKQQEYQATVEKHKKELSKPVDKKMPFGDFETYLGYLSLVNRF